MAIDWDTLVLKPLHATFGETIIYISRQFGTFTLADAVFDRSYVSVETDAAGVPITSLQTHVGVRLASCPANFSYADGDCVVANGQTWLITDEQPDGKGNVTLILSRAA